MFEPFDYTTYSFLDLSGSLNHPLTDAYLFTGKGIGQIQFQPNQDRTVHEYDVNGTVILARIPETGGKLIITCQQTSFINQWLLYAYNIIEFLEPDNQAATSREWGRMTALIRNTNDGTQWDLKGLSFMGRAETSWQSTGGMIIWPLMYAEANVTSPNPSGAGQMDAISKRVKNLF